MAASSANNTDSNITKKLVRDFLAEFEKNRVATKTVNTKMITGEFSPQFGTTVDWKRPHQYRAVETDGGDITDKFNKIISGKAPATVQQMITVAIPYGNVKEATELDQLQDIIKPAAQECLVKFETRFQEFMIANCGLSYGTVGTALTKWGDPANFRALQDSIGVPAGVKHYCLTNPFQMRNLADTQSGLASGNNKLVDTAWAEAQVGKIGGMNIVSSNSMSNYTSSDATDRDGTLSATPDATYLTAKDSMKQTLVLTGLDGTGISAGDVLEFTGGNRNRVNVRTREVIFDQDGNTIPWRCTVTADAAISGGNATVIVTNAAIFEPNPGSGENQVDGQYNNISSALTNSDAFTILGATSQNYQPNLFYVEDSFGVGTVRLPKLNTWDTTVWSPDGISVRCTKYSDGTLNEQFIRFDLLPVFAVWNPLTAGTGWGE